MDRSEWGDQRLTDHFQHIDQRLKSVEGVNVRLAALETEFGFLRTDVHECNGGVKELQKALTQRQKEREQERKERERERKQDRKWWTGTSLATGTLLLAGIALISDKF